MSKTSHFFLVLLLIPIILVVCLLPAKHAVAALPQSVGGFQSSAWTSVSSPVTTTLNSVSMDSLTDGWSVGNSGTILRWNGSVWSVIASPVSSNLTSVAAVSANDGWAVGGSTILRWNGEIWEKVNGAPNLPFQAVYADNANAWFVGGYAICNPACYDFTGFISHWNGISWSTTYTSHTYLYSISMTGAANGWAVGDLFSVSQPYSTVTNWNGNSWTNVNHPMAKLYSVSALSASNAWAVGQDSNYECTSLTWDGSTWTQIACPINETVRAVSMASDNDVWANGDNGMIMNWNGSSWTLVNSPVTTDFKSIDMLSRTEGWAVGSNGTILHYAPQVTLTINHRDGKPGSFFTLTGADFQPNSTTSVYVNGNRLTDTLMIDATGRFVLILDTSQADAGFYRVTTSANPFVGTSFMLDPMAPLHQQEGSSPIVDVPAGIALNMIFLPVIQK